MARAKQTLRVWSARASRKDGRSNGRLGIIIIDRRSVGTIIINGVPHSYNTDLVYHDGTPGVEQMVEDSTRKKRKKKVVRIKRK